MTTQPNTTIDSPQALGTIEYLDPETSNCQYLWIGVFQATSVSVC